MIIHEKQGHAPSSSVTLRRIGVSQSDEVKQYGQYKRPNGGILKVNLLNTCKNNEAVEVVLRVIKTSADVIRQLSITPSL